MEHDNQATTGKILNGLFWVTCSRGSQTLMQFLVIIILARLVSPAEFGIVTAAMIIIGFSEIITELGIGTAIVQRKSLNEQHLNTGYIVSFTLAIVSGIIVFVLAPYVALFFGSSQMEPVLKVLALLFLLRGIGTIGESLAQREMRFRWLASRDVFSFGAGYFVFGVIPALLGYGVWALVSANLATAALKSTLLLISYPPKSLKFRTQAFWELFTFGGGHTIARIANFAALRADNFIVGRFLGMAALGIYGRAYQLTGLPASVFGQILDKVLFPSMAKMQDRKEKLAAIYLRGASLIAMLTLPASVCGFIAAPEIINVVLGEDWTAVILPFRILLLGLLMRSGYKLSDLLAKATGAVYRRAWRHGLYALTVILGGWIGQFWGIPGVAVGVLTAVTLNFLLMTQLSLSLTEKGWADFAAVFVRPAFLTATYFLVIYPAIYVFRHLGLHDISLLAGTATVSVIFAFSVVKLAPNTLLGSHGLWLLNTLGSYLPKALRKLLLTQNEECSNKTVGSENAGLGKA
jgi:PST family polysaccharide transporter